MSTAAEARGDGSAPPSRWGERPPAPAVSEGRAPGGCRARAAQRPARPPGRPPPPRATPDTPTTLVLRVAGRIAGRGTPPGQDGVGGRHCRRATHHRRAWGTLPVGRWCGEPLERVAP